MCRENIAGVFWNTGDISIIKIEVIQEDFIRSEAVEVTFPI